MLRCVYRSIQISLEETVLQRLGTYFRREGLGFGPARSTRQVTSHRREHTRNDAQVSYQLRFYRFGADPDAFAAHPDARAAHPTAAERRAAGDALRTRRRGRAENAPSPPASCGPLAAHHSPAVLCICSCLEGRAGLLDDGHAVDRWLVVYRQCSWFPPTASTPGSWWANCHRPVPCISTGPRTGSLPDLFYTRCIPWLRRSPSYLPIQRRKLFRSSSRTSNTLGRTRCSQQPHKRTCPFERGSSPG